MPVEGEMGWLMLPNALPTDDMMFRLLRTSKLNKKASVMEP